MTNRLIRAQERFMYDLRLAVDRTKHRFYGDGREWVDAMVALSALIDELLKKEDDEP